MFRKIFLLVVFLTLTVALACGWSWYWFVALHPGTEIEPENIQRILGKETPVFYSDGTTRVGVFFDQAHRQYVSYEQIPVDFVNALVAAEDKRFFSHHGFDPPGILRAAIRNYQVGRVVQGGSTLTQQTAKNLFKRRGRSYQAKFEELLYALRLEYHYPKEKIFEFYANQFYVSGNGHGLGVAARYYFNKTVAELSLMESAFIAGSVKKPNFYNPFIKKNDADANEARRQANIRMRYVLGQMLEAQMISTAQFQEASAGELVFQQGTIGYAQDYVMDMVTEAVSTPEVMEALKERGVENLSTSGLRVVTTVEENLQRQTLYSLRQELSRLDVRLRGYNRLETQKELEAVSYAGDRVLRDGAFLFGTIQKIFRDTVKGKPLVRIEVDLGKKIGIGVIQEEGLMGVLSALLKWQQGRWKEATVKDLPLLLSELREGDRVWVSVREISPENGVRLALEKYPKVQGGALILQDGLIRAMAGGVENRFFNRAIAARRTMGSAFKPFVYTAALQLGWNPADLLNNRRNVFVFHRQPYFPRPDHAIEHHQVSMSWAGVQSENLASVWLLYHLCDHLSASQFQDVAFHVGLTPQTPGGKKESYETYAARIRDRHGILVNRTVLENAAFEQAVRNLETDFIFENRYQEYAVVKNLRYGVMAAGFAADLDNQLAGRALTQKDRQELAVRKSLLGGQSYLALVDLQRQLENFRGEVEDPWHPADFPAVQNDQGKPQLYHDASGGRYVFARRAKAGFEVVRVDELRERLFSLDRFARNEFWSDVLLDSLLSSAALGLVRNEVESELRRLTSQPPYSFEVLSAVKDFRVLVGIRYLINFARELGVSSRLDPVLSFPLGANVVSLLELVRVYEGIVTGEVVLSEGRAEETRDLLSVIDRIESEDGEVLYTPQRRRLHPVAPETSLMVGHILENTVKFGTGRYADKNVRLNSMDEDSVGRFSGFDLSVPLLGKTGTANDYTNASFFGYLPGVAAQGEGLTTRDGYAVGVYVGFDDNQEMRRSSTRITGSEGALPTWTELVRILLKEKGYSQRIDPVEVSFSGLSIQHKPFGQLNLEVQAGKGGTLSEPARQVDVSSRSVPSIMTFGKLDEQGRFIPARQFKPYWAQRQ